MSTTTQKQLQIAHRLGPFEVVSNVPVPKPGPGYVLVKVLAASLNPVDWKIQDSELFKQEYPVVLGTDIAGEVVELGNGVNNLKVGDKIVFQGTWSKENSRVGFSQYALAEADYAARIPSNVTVEEASTIPVALGAAVVALYGLRPLGIELIHPFDASGRGKYSGKPFVLLGGATSVGQNVLQLAKLSGFSPIITTASSSNEALLKSFGATHVLDRKLSDSELASQISSITSEPITLVYDSVGSKTTQYTGYSLLSSSQQGQLVLVLASEIEEKDKAPNKEIVHTFGVFTLPNTRELGKKLYEKLEELLANGEIKPNKVELLSGGLAGIPGGLDKLKNNQVSAAKLVARPHETA